MLKKEEFEKKRKENNNPKTAEIQGPSKRLKSKLQKFNHLKKAIVK